MIKPWLKEVPQAILSEFSRLSQINSDEVKALLTPAATGIASTQGEVKSVNPRLTGSITSECYSICKEGDRQVVEVQFALDRPLG